MYYFISWDTLFANYFSYVDLLQAWIQSGDAVEEEYNGEWGVKIYLNSTTDGNSNGLPDFLDTNAGGGFEPSQNHDGT